MPDGVELGAAANCRLGWEPWDEMMDEEDEKVVDIDGSTEGEEEYRAYYRLLASSRTITTGTGRSF